LANRTLKVWSAGCSSGEEPYTIAIVLAEFSEKNPGFDFSILGTDISTQILQKAIDAVYKEDRVNVVPLEMKRKYLLRSKDRTNPTVKIAPQLRKKVRYGRLNFMDNQYDIPETFDVIFCRNVLIYFDRETQERVIDKLCGKLKSGGYFFLGHSESIMNMNLPLRQIKPTIFKRI
jgi:chemotaxis protein methyltransferase CheR